MRQPPCPQEGNEVFGRSLGKGTRGGDDAGRAAAASKMIERGFRIGARLAREFGADPVEMLRVAQRQIEREIPGAKDAIAEARVAEHAAAAELARAALE